MVFVLCPQLGVHTYNHVFFFFFFESNIFMLQLKLKALEFYFQISNSIAAVSTLALELVTLAK